MKRRDIIVGLTVSTTAAGCLGGDDEPDDGGGNAENRTDEGSDDDSNGDGRVEDESNDTSGSDAEDDTDGDDSNGSDDEESGPDWEQRVEDAIESSDHTVTVGGDEDVFDPDELEVTAGESVAFVWNGNNYDLSVTDVPDEAFWQGYSAIRHEPFVHTNTFLEKGVYEYESVAQQEMGDDMSGTIIVDGD